MATELAKAYVQIIPSARGIKGSLSNELGGEADSAGSSAGKTFGQSMVSVLKSVVIAAGIGKMISSAITEGAALEQSIGGIETLFKDSADKVKQNAENAYRTAGMSANEYMELTTSFSASLLQSVAGDTAKAADIADMAMTDMSDNANKMGTNMEDIKNAYQGFAKQNYTLLDNLKLGYGGTKTEMQRLLKDAQKITGVKYDINNLSDVYEAIHVIQGELDITGTTAKEASSTISGSMSAMKSAFKNVLGKLTLGQDVGPALSGLSETVTTFLVGNFLPAVWNILRAIPGALVTFIQEAVPQLTTALMEFMPQMKTGITTRMPEILQMAKQIITQLCEGFMEALPDIFQTALDIITEFINTFIENLPQIIEMGTSVLMTLIDGIREAFPQMLVAAADAILSMAKGLIENFPEILSAGFDMIVSLIEGIGNAFPDIVSAAGDVVDKIWNAICETDWLQLGKDIISGLINGIGAMGNALWDAAKGIAKSAFDAIKGFFGIASPSKLMKEKVGKFVSLGLAEGITDNIKPVTRAMNEITKATTGQVQTDLLISTQSNTGRDGGLNTERIITMGGVTINVYPEKEQDPKEIANEIGRILSDQCTRLAGVYK